MLRTYQVILYFLFELAYFVVRISLASRWLYVYFLGQSKVFFPLCYHSLESYGKWAKKLGLSFYWYLSSFWIVFYDSGWTGAQLAQLLQEAALIAVRKGHKSIIQSDLDAAVDRLTVGPKRVEMDLGHQGQCRRATTEVGTAMTSHLLRHFENAEVERCDRISINARGQVISLSIFSQTLSMLNHSLLRHLQQLSCTCRLCPKSYFIVYRMSLTSLSGVHSCCIASRFEH